MTLTFSTKFPKGKPVFDNEPTHFIEKIVYGLHLTGLFTKGALVEPFRKGQEKGYSPFLNGLYVDTLPKIWEGMNPKIHTIRPTNNRYKTRWKAGNKIHFKVWRFKPYRSKTFAFAPVTECTGVQKISIRYKHFSRREESEVTIKVDGKALNHEEALELAVNDGFDDLEQFLWWFDEDFTGVIIHWTPKRYGHWSKEKVKENPVVDAGLVKPIGYLGIEEEDIKVSQVTVADVYKAQMEIVNRVLKNHLGRKPDVKDIRKCHKVITGQYPEYRYELYFESVKLGIVTAETMADSNIKFRFHGEE